MLAMAAGCPLVGAACKLLMCRERITEPLLYRPERFHKFELLALRTLAVDQLPALRETLRDAVGIGLDRRRSTLLLGGDRDRAIGSDLSHAPACRFRL